MDWTFQKEFRAFVLRKGLSVNCANRDLKGMLEDLLVPGEVLQEAVVQVPRRNNHASGHEKEREQSQYLTGRFPLFFCTSCQNEL